MMRFLFDKSRRAHKIILGIPILESDEVKWIGDDLVLAFFKGVRPMLLKKIKYSKYAPWTKLYDRNPLEIKKEA